MENFFLLAAGFALLLLGGEFLVRGAVRLASALGVSPLVIGLTIVGFGTSTPELVTSVQAALVGAPGIAYGNIVGSNIANILLIGGVSALLFPIAITSQGLQRDGMVMMIVAMAFVAMAALSPMPRLIGAVGLLCLAGYIYLAFRSERQTLHGNHGAAFDKALALQTTDQATLAPAQSKGGWSAALIALAGLALVVLGGRLLVTGAVDLARDFGISETVIGLTIVAVGTSMPELVTSIVAGFKRQGEVAFGNIVGSNIYNILGIASSTALIAPGAVPAQIVGFDNLVMLAVTALFVLLAWTGMRISRWEGAVLLLGYVIYFLTIWP